MMGNAKKAVATVDETPKDLVDPALFDYGDDAGAGFEGTTLDDVSIPFLNVMQANSPTVADGKHANGDIVNSISGDVYKGVDGLPIQPFHYEKKFVKWKPRDQGGGLVAVYNEDDEYVQRILKLNSNQRYGKLKTEDGMELIETRYVYVNILNREGTEKIGSGMIALTSTKIKRFRDWNTNMQNIRLKTAPPIWAFRTLMTVTKEKNTRNEPYNNVVFKPLVGDGTSWMQALIPPSHPLYKEGKAMAEAVISGAKKADFSKQHQSDDGGDTSSQPDGEDKVPF